MKNSTSLENHSRAWRLRGERYCARFIIGSARIEPDITSLLKRRKRVSGPLDRKKGNGSNELISVQPVDHHFCNRVTCTAAWTKAIFLEDKRGTCCCCRGESWSESTRETIEEGVRKMVGTTRALLVSRVFGGSRWGREGCWRARLSGFAYWSPFG